MFTKLSNSPLGYLQITYVILGGWKPKSTLWYSGVCWVSSSFRMQANQIWDYGLRLKFKNSATVVSTFDKRWHQVEPTERLLEDSATGQQVGDLCSRLIMSFEGPGAPRGVEAAAGIGHHGVKRCARHKNGPGVKFKGLKGEYKSICTLEIR